MNGPMKCAALVGLAIAACTGACSQAAREDAFGRWCDSSERCARTDTQTGKTTSGRSLCRGNEFCTSRD